MNETMPNAPLKILLVEDYELSRNGLKYLLSLDPSLDIVGEAINGQEALNAVAQLRPDVVLMDIGMPVMDGITATHQLKQRYPATRVIMLTSHSQSEEVLACLSAGCDGYCLKDMQAEELINVIKSVAEGAVWLSPVVAPFLTRFLAPYAIGSNGDVATWMGTPPDAITLTEREFHVLQLIVEGYTNKEIADAYNISEHTAKSHVKNVIQKLGVENRTQVAVKAIKESML